MKIGNVVKIVYGPSETIYFGSITRINHLGFECRGSDGQELWFDFDFIKSVETVSRFPLTVGKFYKIKCYGFFYTIEVESVTDEAVFSRNFQVLSDSHMYNHLGVFYHNCTTSAEQVDGFEQTVSDMKPNTDIFIFDEPKKEYFSTGYKDDSGKFGVISLNTSKLYLVEDKKITKTREKTS